MPKPKCALKPIPTFESEIPVRLPDMLLTELKLVAIERDVPYQRLLKVYLADRIGAERCRKDRRAGA